MIQSEDGDIKVVSIGDLRAPSPSPIALFTDSTTVMMGEVVRVETVGVSWRVLRALKLSLGRRFQGAALGETGAEVKIG
jgi:hypothetical protein